MRQQRHHELSADAVSAKGWPDVEPPHAQSVRYNWFNRETTNAGDRSVYAHSEHGFAGTVKPCPVRLRIGHEPFDLPRSFGERSRSQFGAHSIDIIAEGYVWPHEQNYGVLPSRSMFDALVAANNVNPGPVVLDIEKLPLKVSPKRVQLFYA